jgi:hypothetical protein
MQPRALTAAPGSHNVKIFLDDERATPDGWVRAYWPSEVIAYLQAGGVTEVSLDHDLGNDERGTGYDVVLWVEEAVATRGFVAPILTVHSANSSARAKMEQGIAKIQRLTAEGRRSDPLLDSHRRDRESRVDGSWFDPELMLYAIVGLVVIGLGVRSLAHWSMSEWASGARLLPVLILMAASAAVTSLLVALRPHKRWWYLGVGLTIIGVITFVLVTAGHTIPPSWQK